jgi:hypothetical protein
LPPLVTSGLTPPAAAPQPADAAAFLRQIVTDLDPRQLVTIATGDEQLTLLTARRASSQGC